MFARITCLEDTLWSYVGVSLNPQPVTPRLGKAEGTLSNRAVVKENADK